MRLWQSARKEIEAADRPAITAKQEKTFWKRTAEKRGVRETESGLQYLILEEGEGDCPDANALITVHQRCQLVNGTIIIDTYRENETAEVKVEELIEGYQEGIQLMNKGARYRFFIPWELAWGKNGSGSKIPPYSMLIFDVRLIDFW